MPARAAVQALLAEDPDLIGIGVANVYGGNSVDTPGEELFIIIRWEETTQVFKATGTGRCTIWAHDKNRDYGRIGQVLQRVQDLLLDAEHLAGEDGWTLTLAEWNGEGPDLFDDGYDTVTRYSDFTVVSRYTTS